MTPESQRIAIAEARGINHGVLCAGTDYLNDLNAMAIEEKTLNPIQAAEYARILTSIAWQSEQPVFAPMTATAAQRAEAFLRTLNLWK